MRLLDLIKVIAPEECILTKENFKQLSDLYKISFGDIQSTPMIKIAYEVEEETHFTILATHPALIPLYNVQIQTVDVENGMFKVWLDTGSFIQFAYSELGDKYDECEKCKVLPEV